MRRLGLLTLLAFAVTASTALAASTPPVPTFTQHTILKRTPLFAYVPTRVGFGYRYYRWAFKGGAQPALRIWFRHKDNPSKAIVFIASPQSGACTAGKEKSFQLAGNKVYWAQTSEEQQAWRCVRGVHGKLVRLTVATAMPPTTYADVGLGRIDASARRIR
jgi:hypothetical protein